MKRIQGYSEHERLVLRTGVRIRANPAGRGAKALRDRSSLVVVVNSFLLQRRET